MEQRSGRGLAMSSGRRRAVADIFPLQHHGGASRRASLAPDLSTVTEGGPVRSASGGAAAAVPLEPPPRSRDDDAEQARNRLALLAAGMAILPRLV